MNKKKLFVVLVLLFSLLILGAKCRKVAETDVNLSLSGELKDGSCCAGLTRNLGGGNNISEDVVASSVSIDIKEGKVEGQYHWAIEVKSLNLVGETMVNGMDEQGTFKGEMTGANEFVADFKGQRLESTGMEGGEVMSETNESVGQVVGQIETGKVSAYFTAPTVTNASGTPRVTESMATSMQNKADKSGDPLHGSYLYFELER